MGEGEAAVGLGSTPGRTDGRGNGGVVPLVAPVLEVGVEAVRVDADIVSELIVSVSGKPVAMAVVAILADGVVVIERIGESRSRVKARRDVVDASPVVVIVFIVQIPQEVRLRVAASVYPLLNGS